MKKIIFEYLGVISALAIAGCLFVFSGCAINGGDFELEPSETEKALSEKVDVLTKENIELKKIISERDSIIVELREEIRETKIELIRYKELLKKSEGDNIEVVNDYKKQIKILTEKITELETKCTEYVNTINEYESYILTLKLKIVELENSSKNKDAEIEKLNNTIKELQERIKELEKVNKELNTKATVIYIKGWRLGCDGRNWVINNKVVVNNIDLKNNSVKYGDYVFVFVEE